MTRVHQVCARLQFGDAITNHVLRIHALLLARGIESHVYAHDNDEFHAGDNEGEALYRRSYRRSREDLLIYHYSVYNDNYRLYQGSRNRKVFIYHNITPPGFFEPYHREIATVCRKGLKLLPELRDCDLALGDSDFNRRELVAAGFAGEKSGVLPILLAGEKLERDNPALTERLRSLPETQLLFIGRLVPNKRVEDLLRFFAYYRRVVNLRSRLWVVGSSWSREYNLLLYRTARSLGLTGWVEFPGGSGGVPDPDLTSYLRSADAFVTMSEHEGFCVPLVEAMYHGVPVFAYGAAAIPDTLAGSGVMFNRKNWPYLAEAVEEVLRDEALRRGIVAGQRRRWEELSPARTEEKLFDYLRPFL
jgi:glycosyltransferase involved in cell wall biosynthesis